MDYTAAEYADAKEFCERWPDSGESPEDVIKIRRDAEKKSSAITQAFKRGDYALACNLRADWNAENPRDMGFSRYWRARAAFYAAYPGTKHKDWNAKPKAFRHAWLQAHDPGE